MLEAYLDESDNVYHKIFAVGALVIDQENKEALSASLNEISSSVMRRMEVQREGPALELHGKDVYGGCGEWRHVPTRLRLRAYEKSLEAIRDKALRFIVKPINYETLIWKDPHHLAMLWALERVQDISSNHDTDTLVFADRKPEAEQGLRQAFENAKVSGTRGYRPSRLARISEEVIFEDSKDNRLIQACDMALFIHHRLVFERRKYGIDPDGWPPKKKASILATKRLDAIIKPIKSPLASWP